jgi:hypothetical protein
MAFVSYLIAPTERAPRYGLDHEFSIDSDEFLATIAGATGVPGLRRNSVEVLNNGDEFYPVMLREIAARASRSPSRRTSTGLERSGASSPTASPPRLGKASR